MTELGHAFDGNQEYAKAIEQLTEASELAHRSEDVHSIGLVLFKLGRVYYHNRQMPESREAFLSAQRKMESLNHLEARVAILNYLIFISIWLGEKDDALQLAKEHAYEYERAGNAAGHDYAIAIIALVEDALDAKKDNGMLIDTEFNITPYIGPIYWNAIMIYLNSTLVEKAIEWFEKGIPYLKERHVEILQGGPDESPYLNELRAHSRFDELVGKYYATHNLSSSV